MVSIFKFIPVIVIAVLAAVRFLKERNDGASHDYRYLIVAAAAAIGCLSGESSALAFIGFRMYIPPLGFILIAIGALLNKKPLSVIGAFCFPLGHRLFHLITGFVITLPDLISTAVYILVIAVALFISKSKKISSVVAWVVLLIIGLILGDFLISLALIAVSIWLSSELEGAVKLTGFGKKAENVTIATSTTNDKLAVLERMQDLLADGIITRDEFEAKKKQLLGLSNTHTAPATPQSIGKCIICGRENVPLESIEVVVAGMSRKRTMCADCAAKHK